MNLAPPRLALQRAYHAVAVAQAAARASGLNTAAQPSACFLREVLQVEGIHSALEPNVQVSDLASGDSDDADAREGQALEQAGRVFLVATESIQ